MLGAKAEMYNSLRIVDRQNLLKLGSFQVRARFC